MSTINLSDDSRVVLVSLVQKFLTERNLIPQGSVLENIVLTVKPVAVCSVDNLDQLLFDSKLAQPVSVLKIEGRAVPLFNCFGYRGIYSVGQVVRLTEMEIRKWRNIGDKSVDSLKRALEKEELCLGLFAPIGPLEKEFYRRQPIAEPHFEPKVVALLNSIGIQTYGDLSRLDEKKQRIRAVELLERIQRDVSPNSNSYLNQWLNRYPTGEDRLNRLMVFAKTLDLKTQSTSFP